MKFSDVSFPHPVLGIGDAINSYAGFKPEPQITSGTNNYTVVVNCEHNNNDLSVLINNGEAEFFCEATCSITLYRGIIKGNSNLIEFEIPKKHVKGRVDFICALLATSPIANYQNSNSHPDYSNYDFEIEVGDILAYFGRFSFDADIKYEKLKAVSSFMEVVENKDPKAEYTNVDLSKNKIEVQLPSEDYKTFANESVSKEQKFAPVFHSSIVLNALIMALYNFEEHKELLWAKVIEYRLKNEKQFESMSLNEKEDIPEVAQRLLGNPFRRLISELQVIIESPSDIEDF
ncbi:MAG: hypothetical protein WD577_09490 [Bacteroidales bacterium]